MLATVDARIVDGFTTAIRAHGIAVSSLLDAYLPEVSTTGSAAEIAIAKAAGTAGATGKPALGIGCSFEIAPLGRGSGIRPMWQFPDRWPFGAAELRAQIARCDAVLIRGGYVGPNDRCAYFRCVLALTWPDMESELFEGFVDGQFYGWPDSQTWADCLELDGERTALAQMAPQQRREHDHRLRALDAFMAALSARRQPSQR